MTDDAVTDTGDAAVDLFRLLAETNLGLADAAHELRSLPGVSRVLRECDLRGNEHGSEFSAFAEVHTDEGPYVCLWFELVHANRSWEIEARVDAAHGVGESIESVGEYPTAQCEDLTSLRHACRQAVQWLTRVGTGLDYRDLHIGPLAIDRGTPTSRVPFRAEEA